MTNDSFSASSLNWPKTSQVSLFLQSKVQGFTGTIQTLAFSSTTAVALDDLDGDGDLDVFVGNGGGQVNQVWLNDGAGTFDADNIRNLGSANSQAVALGDLDGDGDPDVVIGNIGANTVWLNDGTGNFSDSGQSLGSTNSLAVALGDLDGDGDLDIFVGNSDEAGGEGGQTNQVFLNLDIRRIYLPIIFKNIP